MAKPFDVLSAAEKQQLVTIAKSEASNLVPDAQNIGFAVRDQQHDAAAQADIAANQLHLNLTDDNLHDVVLRHVEGLLEKVPDQQTTGGGRKFYFPGDPASKRVLLKKLRDGNDLKGLAAAQAWIEGAGLSNVSELFQVEAQNVRNRLYADHAVQSAIALDPNPLPKVRALGSGIHTAAEKAVNMLEAKGYAVHDINTDDVCCDWSNAVTDIRNHLAQRAPKENMYFTAMLLTPDEAKKEAANHPEVTMSSDAVAQKARTFAITLKEILLPEHKNILLVDKDLNVVLHREGGREMSLNEAALANYYKACGVQPPRIGGAGQGQGPTP